MRSIAVLAVSLALLAAPARAADDDDPGEHDPGRVERRLRAIDDQAAREANGPEEAGDDDAVDAGTEAEVEVERDPDEPELEDEHDDEESPPRRPARPVPPAAGSSQPPAAGATGRERTRLPEDD